MNSEEAPSLTYQPFGGMVHSAFRDPTQKTHPIRRSNPSGRNQHNIEKGTTNMTTAETIKSEANKGHSVPEQRAAANEARTPHTGGAGPSDHVVSMLVQQSDRLIEQNAKLLSQHQELIAQTNQVVATVLGGIHENLKKQNERVVQDEFFETMRKEVKKTKNGEKSLFNKTRLEKAEDAAWMAGGVAVGVSVGYGAYVLAASGVKALMGA